MQVLFGVFSFIRQGLTVILQKNKSFNNQQDRELSECRILEVFCMRLNLNWVVLQWENSLFLCTIVQKFVILWLFVRNLGV